MEGMGPESKRQRMEYNGPQRHPPQLHSHTSTLPPPHTYPPPQQPPPPPSPYDVAPHDQRSLPEPTGPHAYVQEHSGHSTPIREQRFHPEPEYSRRSSASMARSPDGHHNLPARSMSIATTAEGQHYPPQYPVDPGVQSTYPSHEPSNGSLHHGLPTHPYDQAHTYPPSHPMEYAHSPITAGPHGYPQINQYAVQFGPPGSRTVKKGNRATQACDICRMRKAKCDEGRPECGFCVENSMKCNYQSVAPPKADRANQQIIDQLSAHKEDIKGLKECWESLGGRFDKIEQMLAAIGAGQGTANPGSDVKTPQLKVESSPHRSVGDPEIGSARAAVKDQKATVNGDSNASFATSSGDSNGPDPLTSQTNAIYIEHDTAAQKLFRWRSIKALLRQSKDLAFSSRTEDYVMDHETNKGVLRMYGKGRQMREISEGSQSSGSVGSPANSAVSAPSDEASTSSSPAASPPETLWGTGLIPTFLEARAGDGAGGLNPDNTLNLEPKVLTRLLRSYLDNIHILHPFLEEQGLIKLVDRFKQRYNPVDLATSRASFAVPVAVDNLREHKAPKRKHSDGPYLGESTFASNSMSPKALLDRSPQTALTLLVMALGKICEYRGQLPGPVPDGSREAPNPTAHAYSPVGGRIDSPPPTYAMRHSPSSSSHSTANTSAPSPLGPARYGLSSPRSSIGELPANTRNVDVIPGLAYYAQASDILGNLTGFHDLVNAQCCLLAGLYAGQLANTLESLTWIQSASRICRLLVKKPNFKTMKQPKADLVKLAFWTSLQLESDILAELDIPPSGIQEVQDVVQYPQTTMAPRASINGETEPSEIMMYYAAQLHMRKLLNDIQKELYQESKFQEDPTFQRATRGLSLRNAFNDMITNWRMTLPENLRWDDNDPLAQTINDARLRGKFYGAQYIIHRPFLHAALDYDFEPSSIQSPPDAQLNGAVPVPPGPDLVMGPPKMTPPDYETRKRETILLAQICIRAAEKSTVAFDGVLDHRRLIVTNIMGTAHAQFGNMLVLSAAFKSKTLSGFVESRHLDKLFNRTIKLLKDLAPISQTLARDCFILQCLRRVVFEGGDPELSTSFSSDS